MIFSPIGLVCLDQMFKFSTSFATEVEKNRPSHGCFNRGLRSTKDSKRATGNFSPSTNNVRARKTTVRKLKKAKIVSSEHIANVTGHRGINFLNDYDEADEEELR